jgi:hypothetical protein
MKVKVWFTMTSRLEMRAMERCNAAHHRGNRKQNRLAAFLVIAIAQTVAADVRAQTPDDDQLKISGVPPVVQRVAKSLWLRARMYVETGSPTFYAVGVRAQDTSQIMKEFAPTRRVNPRTTKALADALRAAARQEFARETQAVGIIMDSIATAPATGWWMRLALPCPK